MHAVHVRCLCIAICGHAQVLQLMFTSFYVCILCMHCLSAVCACACVYVQIGDFGLSQILRRGKKTTHPRGTVVYSSPYLLK